jgi:hypothetical protein
MSRPERGTTPAGEPPELSADESAEAVTNAADKKAQGDGLELAITPEQARAERQANAEKVAKTREFMNADRKGRERIVDAEAREREHKAEQEAKEAAFALARTWQERAAEGKKQIETKADGKLTPDEAKENDAIVQDAAEEFQGF